MIDNVTLLRDRQRFIDSIATEKDTEILAKIEQLCNYLTAKKDDTANISVFLSHDVKTWIKLHKL